VKELKGFGRVILQPGETKTVSMRLDKAAMSYYDPAVHEWVAEPGRFTVLVGASSRDIRARGEFELAR
jgi:beta-glucosidase